MAYDVDQTFILDNVIYTRQLQDFVPDIPGEVAGTTIDFPIFSYSLCEYYPILGRFQRGYHDPTLTVLFTPPPEPTGKPLTPQQKEKAAKNNKLALGLGIGFAVLVVLLILIVIIVVLLSDKAKNFFRPYRARKKPTDDRKDSARWSKGQLPPQ